MQLIEVISYDERRSYGVDWITEYRCKSDKDLTLKEALAELEKLGHKANGEISYSYDYQTKDLIIKAKMY